MPHQERLLWVHDQALADSIHIESEGRIPAVPGLYRLAADGSKATTGQPWTWRRVRPGETGPWTCYGMAGVPASGEIETGPLAGAPDLPLVLEG